MSLSKKFWAGRRVLLTGHTGFKGAWLSMILEKLGADVYGVSLPPIGVPNIYATLGTWPRLNSFFCDINDKAKLSGIVNDINPEIVIHMAAQSLVRESYLDPVQTIETNVLGTVNLLESLRSLSELKAILIVTSDKVYANDGKIVSLNEQSPLGGYDPYSASKAAAEIILSSYHKSFFAHKSIPLCSVRAGNVIGGGDWAKDRIIPDLWRAYIDNTKVEMRYPEAVRPWQHVLDPLYGYLLYIEKITENPTNNCKAMNFGPSIKTTRTVRELAKRFAQSLDSKELWVVTPPDEKLSESKYLSIDSSLAKSYLGWVPILEVDRAIDWTGEWYKAYKDGQDMQQFSNKQIDSFFNLLSCSEFVPIKKSA